MLLGLPVLCVTLACADVVYEKHPHIEFERWFNFYGFLSLIALAATFLLSFLLRRVLEREEDYYDG